MGIFRPDNSKRGQRCTDLANQARLYFDQHKQYADSCEASAEKLFESVKTIAAAQGRTLPEILGLPSGYENVVFDGGFEYHGLDSVGKTLSFSQWFVLASVVGSGVVMVGAQGMFLYTGYVLARMADGAAFAARMSVLRLMALGRAGAASEGGIGPAARVIRWARFARYAEVGSLALIPVSLGLDLWCDEEEYSDYVNAIHNLAPIRLDTCTHALLMKALSDSISELAVKAGVYAQNPQIASSFDILKEFDAVTQSLIAAFKNVPSLAFNMLKKDDEDQQAYTTDDPDLSTHVSDLANDATPSKIDRLDVSADFAVDWLQAQTNHGDGLRFGGTGGTLVSNEVADDEVITRATWKTGTLAAGSTKKVIFNLVITTNKRSLGPFGTGGDMVKADAEEQTFDVPDKMTVCGLVDLASEVVDDQGNTTMVNQPYICELRFVVVPAE